MLQTLLLIYITIDNSWNRDVNVTSIISTKMIPRYASRVQVCKEFDLSS